MLKKKGCCKFEHIMMKLFSKKSQWLFLVIFVFGLLGGKIFQVEADTQMCYCSVEIYAPPPGETITVFQKGYSNGFPQIIDATKCEEKKQELEKNLTTTDLAKIGGSVVAKCSIINGTSGFAPPSFSSDASKVVDISSLNKLGTTDVASMVSNIIKTAMGIIGAIALAMFIYGGFLWMTSMGAAEREKKAIEIITWTSLGIVVILASYAIINYVFEIFT